MLHIKHASLKSDGWIQGAWGWETVLVVYVSARGGMVVDHVQNRVSHPRSCPVDTISHQGHKHAYWSGGTRGLMHLSGAPGL